MRSGGQRLTLLLLAALFCVQSASAQAPDDAFRAALAELREATYAEKAQIVDRISESGHTSARQVLAPILEDRLYVRSSDQGVFIVKSGDDALTTLQLVDPVTLKDLGSASRDVLTKIGTNNGLRKALKTAVARFDLSSVDGSVRLDAVKEMMRSLDDAS